MKTRINLTGLALMLLALFSSSHPASAYYDPGVQRWPNRDPIGKKGGINLFTFILNSPTRWIDIYGLYHAEGHDETANTIVCDGNGGVEVQIGTGNAPNTSPAVLECIKAHEEAHIRDVLLQNPGVCNGVPAGTEVVPDSYSEQAETERNACHAGNSCLRAKHACGEISDKEYKANMDRYRRYCEQFRERHSPPIWRD